jgi:ubiquitin carboxyl-terminal hydrolase 2/21
MRLIEQPEKTHLIEFNWAVSYTNYIKEDNLPVPSTIDNQPLLERIKNNEQLIVDRDYVLINE